MTVTRRFRDAGLFLAEFVRSHHYTGSVTPSSSWLAAALARHVRPVPAGRPRAILEVGPGTGAVTRQIARRLGPADTLEIVEANPRFVQRLRHLLDTDPVLRPVADRVRLWEGTIERYPGLTGSCARPGYDAIVCGLPFTNFAPQTVERILTDLIGVLAPDGRLSFFGYVALRRLQQLVSSHPVHSRLAGVEMVLSELMDRHRVGRDLVLGNLPPAWVFHLARERT